MSVTVATPQGEADPPESQPTGIVHSMSEDVSEGCIAYSAEVEAALTEVVAGSDPLDRADFSVVDYINQLFPTEQSLSSIDEVVNRIKVRMRSIDEEIRSVVRGSHSESGNPAQQQVVDGRESLEEARVAIQALFARIREVKERADKSEQMVREITRDIQQLDTAKRNLTLSITTLNHLVILVNGVDRLRQLSDTRNYEEIRCSLESVLNVLEHFQPYMDIPQLQQLAGDVKYLEGQLSQQILSDFKEMFQGPTSRSLQSNAANILSACRVVDLLEARVKSELLDWFVRQQLAEYLVLFEESQEAAWLDKIDRRYAWCKKNVNDFETKFAGFFPRSWFVTEKIVVAFCESTVKELGSLMAKRRDEIEVKLLLFAISRTKNFEEQVAKNFTGETLVNNVESPTVDEQLETPGADDGDALEPDNPFYQGDQPSEQVPLPSSRAASREAMKLSPFQGIITKVFEPYLDIYLAAQDRNLADLMQRFVQDAASKSIDAGSVMAQAASGSNTLPSSGDLFMFYKMCLEKCLELSNREPLIGLTQIFKKYLKEYAMKILVNGLPQLQRSRGGAAVSRELLQTFLRDSTGSGAGAVSDSSSGVGGGSSGKLSETDQARICTVLCTAAYCHKTTENLEEKLKQRVDSGLQDDIDLKSELDQFHHCISTCIQLLVADLEAACEPALTAMSKLPWSTVEAVGDQSNYVSALVSHLRQNVPVIRDNLSECREYFTKFCNKFVSSFIQRFVVTLFKCKPVNTVGAEQLLLDTHSLKTVLLELPSINSQVKRAAPPIFTKIVVKEMTRAEMIMKCVMSPSNNSPQAFVENFLKLLPNSDVNTFQKVLEMRGMKRTDQTVLLDCYKSRCPGSAGSGSVAGGGSDSGNPGMAATVTAGMNTFLNNMNTTDESSRIRKLEKLIKNKF